MLSKSEPTGYWVYGWDHENRMISARKQNQTVRYEYDALGRRVARRGKSAGSTGYTKYVYDGLDVVMDIDGSTVTKYQNGPGIDNKLSLKTGSDVKYFLQDHLGSTVGLTDANGSLTSTQTYDSFGNGTNTSFPTRYQFTGREFDSFTGLQFSRARHYDPKIGRFISEDPIGFEGGDINLYGYVWNSPLRFTDPMGLQGWGSRFADWADERTEFARNWWQRDPQHWVWNGTVNTGADLAFGFSDMFRVGTGAGQALFCDVPDYRRLELFSQDFVRGGGLFLGMAGVGIKLTPKSPTRPKFPGNDPAKAPRGYEWRGKPGSQPGSKDGNYYKPKTRESLRPDLSHDPPTGPHWDYRDPSGKWWRIFPDGTRLPKQ